MIQEFIDLMSTFATLSAEEEAFMRKTTVITHYDKGATILKEGDNTQDAFLIIKGCIRKHLIFDGKEKTTGFFTEGEVVAEFESLSNHTPSSHSYSCVEDTAVVIVNSEEENEFYKMFPRFAEVSRLETEKMLGKNQKQLSNFIVMSPEERYMQLLNENPQLLQRVPQYQIASYLGVTPESLSRIRKRIVKP